MRGDLFATGFCWGFALAIVNERTWTAIVLFVVGASIPVLRRHGWLP